MTKVTVIIPLYNRADLIGLALQSLLAQSADCDLDLLVVDDGSTDEGPDRVRRLADLHSEIRMIRQENTGVTGARNFARLHLQAETEFVSFLDSDDISLPGRFATDLAVFARRPEIQFTYGMLTMFKEFDEERMAPVAGSQTLSIRGVCLSSAIFRRGFFDELGAFDPDMRMGEDLDFLLRAIEGQAAYELTDTVCSYYRRHSGNMTNNQSEARHYLLRALHKSMRRRRASGSTRDASSFFDLQALVESKLDW